MRESSKYRLMLQNLKGLLLLLTVLLTVEITAQTRPIHHYTVRDGLPDIAIQAIYKDSRGLLWIGTRAGLCTFDGRTFRTFTSSEGMTANQIWAIAEDDNGNMWFGSSGEGIFKYDGRQFRRFTTKEGLADDRIRVLCWSGNFRCLVAGSPNGVSTIRDTVISTYPDKSSDTLLFNLVTGICDAGKFMYLTTYDHFNPIRYFPDNNKLESVHDSGIHYPAPSFSCLITSKGDTLFSLGNKGIRIFTDNSTVDNDTLGQVFGMTEDRTGNVWLAAWSTENMELKGGVFRYDGKHFMNYNDILGIKERGVWTVFYDREQDILWVGTEREGLFMMPFTGITIYPSGYFNLATNTINDLFLDSKFRLWISGKKELIRFNPEGGFSLVNKKAILSAFRRFWNDNSDKVSRVMDLSRPTLKEALETDDSEIPVFLDQTDFEFLRLKEIDDQNYLFANRFGLFRYQEGINKIQFIECFGPFFEFEVMGLDTLIKSGEYTQLRTDFSAGFRDPEDDLFFSGYPFGLRVELFLPLETGSRT